jgi:hypothetical protein
MTRELKSHPAQPPKVHTQYSSTTFSVDVLQPTRDLPRNCAVGLMRIRMRMSEKSHMLIFIARMCDLVEVSCVAWRVPGVFINSYPTAQINATDQ